MHKVMLSKEFPDYYEIPGFSNYCVCKDDLLIYSRIRKNYIRFSNKSKSTTLMNDLGKPHGITYTRALNLALNGPKENTNPMDKFTGRTSSKEVKWAEERDLRTPLDPKKPFKARCLLSDDEIRFNNLTEVSKYFKISKKILIGLLEESNSCIINNYVQLWQGKRKDNYLSKNNKSIVFIDDSKGRITIYPNLDICVNEEFLDKEEILYKLENGNHDDDYLRCYYLKDFVIEINREK